MMLIMKSNLKFIVFHGFPLGPFTIHTILSHLYGYHSSLVKVVGILAPSRIILNDDDTELYRRMCTTTLVASNKEDMFDDPIQVTSITHVIGEVAKVAL